jgi:hypothetical protein
VNAGFATHGSRNVVFVKCGEPYVCKDVLEEKLTELLGGLRFEDEIMSWASGRASGRR